MSSLFVVRESKVEESFRYCLVLDLLEFNLRTSLGEYLTHSKRRMSRISVQQNLADGRILDLAGGGTARSFLRIFTRSLCLKPSNHVS